MMVAGANNFQQQVFINDIDAMQREHPNRFARLCYLTWERHGRPAGDRHFGRNHLYDSFAMLAQNVQTVAREKFEQEVNTIRREHPDQFDRLCHLTCERHGRPAGDRHFGENHLYDSFTMLAQNIQTVARETFGQEIKIMRATDRSRFALLCYLNWDRHGRPVGDPRFGENHLYHSFSTLSELIQTVRGPHSWVMQKIMEIWQRIWQAFNDFIINPIANWASLKSVTLQIGMFKLMFRLDPRPT